MVVQLTKEEYEKEQWWIDTQKWIDAIPKELDSKKGSPPLKKWKVFEAETWVAAWNAAWCAARVAARGDAWNAARGAAMGTARGAAMGAARDDAWNAGWSAAWDAAFNTARDDAQNAAWDAALFSSIKVCAGLNIDKKHVKYAEERWEANKRGFGVLCDVNGVLYVYRKRI